MKSSVRTDLLSGFAICGLISLAGCGSGEPPRLATYPVKGVVRMDGKPFGPCVVELVSQEKGGRTVGGAADAQGNITFGTYEVADGGVPGSYKVIVRSAISAPPPTPIPAKYGSDRTSPLSATIKESGANELAFDLDSKLGAKASSAEAFSAASKSDAFGAGATAP